MPTPNLPIKTGHVFIGLAVVMGIATVGLFSGGKHEARKVVQKIDTVDVVVPLTQINQGQTVALSDVKMVKWPKAFVPQGEIFDKAYLVSGRVAKQTLFPGEPIFQQKVSGTNSAGGLTALIPNGKRAITIAVTEIKGVAGFVKPGDRVDVLSTFEIDRDNSQALKKTRTVLQNALVLASAQTMVKDDNYNIETPEGVQKGDAVTKTAAELKEEEKNAKKDKEKKPNADEIQKRVQARKKEQKEAAKEAKLVSSVTLALSPEEAEKLALAEESGELRLILRSESDNSIADLQGMDSDSLKGTSGFSMTMNTEPPPKLVQAPPMPAMPPPPAMPAPILGTQVEFIQGDNKTYQNFN